MSERTLVSAIVAFIAIVGLKHYDSAASSAALSLLHSTAAKWKAKSKNGARFLSTLNGLILILPDEQHADLIPFLEAISRKCYGCGIPVRIGVAHGDIEELQDIDGTANYIGEAINHSARLAFSEQNNGCLAEDSLRRFSDFYFGDSKGGLNLFQNRQVRIKGKRHDKVFICHEQRNDRLRFRKRLRSSKLVFPKPIEASVVGVLIAYDLPHFSSGDRLELSQRFRGVIDTFRLWRNSDQIPKTSNIYFLPGGDGGIIVLTGIKSRAFEIVTRFAELLKIESQNKAEHIAVETRIGVHYGLISLFKDASKITRPSGRNCFIADEIASDKLAKAKRQIVLSEALIDAASEGSNQHFVEKFELLPPMTAGVAKGIKRFVVRREADKDHQLFARLTGPRGSWELS